MERAPCDFCGESPAPAHLVRGKRAAICSGCVARSISSSLGRTAPHELPEADAACAFCDKKAPASALVRASGGETAICVSCLGRGYGFLAQTMHLEFRQQRFRNLGVRTPASVLSEHFAGLADDDVVTSARMFPEYMRVDLNRTLERLLPAPESCCLGLHQEYSHETVTYGSLLHHENSRIALVPLQYDELDVGEVAVARCLQAAIWLVDRPPARHVVLLSPSTRYGRRQGWHVEIAVPRGAAGDEVVSSTFRALEEALSRSATYRGKVLSLEHDPDMMGTGASVIVHRLAPVARDEVILPASTLDLLERNVFRFVAQRPALLAMDLPVKKGLLFYGPPGTGKTHSIRYLAGALPGHTTLLVTADQVVQINIYMALARLLSPSIVVIEDVDLIARHREEMRAPGEEALLNRLLNEMDGLRENADILFVLTTNRPEALEGALTARPGRIDQSIEFPLPDEAGRRKLARLYGKGATLPDATLEHVVDRTARVSAAFIKELMRRAAQFALERASSPALERGDVDAALDELLFSGGRLNAALLGALGARADVTDVTAKP